MTVSVQKSPVIDRPKDHSQKKKSREPGMAHVCNSSILRKLGQEDWEFEASLCYMVDLAKNIDKQDWLDGSMGKTLAAKLDDFCMFAL